MFGICKNKVSYYKESKPSFEMQEYFNGKIKAWGLMQDRRGRIITKFDVDMECVWNGDTGVFKEEFRYYSGRVQNRTWKITKHETGKYTSTAEDIVGTAQGESAGDAVNWVYVIDIVSDGKTYRINTDDWMWKMNDGIVINRSYFRKFGIKFAELTLFMKKG